jgi:hypothetical protein
MNVAQMIYVSKQIFHFKFLPTHTGIINNTCTHYLQNKSAI